MYGNFNGQLTADYETDVLVVGFGGAGAISAVTAYDAGAKVTVIEKLDKGGGATRLSSGGIFVGKDESFADYLYHISEEKTPRDVIDVYAKKDMTLVDDMKEFGIPISFWYGNSQEVSVSYPPLGRPSWPNVEGGNMIRVHATDPDEKPIPDDEWEKMTNNERVWAVGRTYGQPYWDAVKAVVDSRDIDVQYNVRAKELIQNEKGEVIGLIAEKDGQEVVYKADRAVIMCTGGFASNEEMKSNFLDCDFVYLGTNDYATGDGLIMCQKVGAKMWHMNAVCGQIAFKAPEFDQAFQVRAVDEAFVWVDKFGRRYCNEVKEVLHNAWRKVSLFNPDGNNLEDGKEWPRIPIYMIFDESMRQKAPISRDWRPNNDYKWSLDNSEEIKRGWIIQADTIEELAQKIGMEPSVLELTIAEFNDGCRTGNDEFGRDPQTMKPINNGPYYAMPWVPCLVSTCGGPAHDKESHVIDYDGNPIPRLYAVGEVSTAMAWLYEAGWGHSEQFIFGRIAGENAAKEVPLD